MDEQTVEDVVEVCKKNDMIIRVKIVYGRDFQRHICLANESEDQHYVRITTLEKEGRKRKGRD